jgi:hypothetical protein
MNALKVQRLQAKALRRGVVSVVDQAAYDKWREEYPLAPTWEKFADLAVEGKVAVQQRVVKSRAGQRYLALSFAPPGYWKPGRGPMPVRTFAVPSAAAAPRPQTVAHAVASTVMRV